MRPSKLFQLLSLCVPCALLTIDALAQAVAPAPPVLQKLEEGSASDITVRQPENKTRTVEKRQQGVVTDVEVHTGKSTYHLRQDAGAGNAAAGDAQSSHLHPAQFQVHEFDLGRKKDPKVVNEVRSADVLLPPPATK